MGSSIDFDSLPKEAQEAILDKPLAMPPPGVESRIGQPRHLNVMTTALTAASLFVITVCFFLRAYSKIFCSKKIRVEDVFGFIAFGACIVHSYTIIQMDINPGVFLHTWDLRIRDLEPFYKDFTLLRTFYCIDLAFCKNAILLEWIHIFVPLRQKTVFFWLCAGLIAANSILYIAAIIANYIVVIPLEALWKPWMDARYLINRQAADTAVVSFNLLCDILILVLPQRVIWKLQLDRQRKFGLSFLFGLGILTCVFAGGRVYSTTTLDWHHDTLHDVPGVILWGLGESTFAMAVFCVPAVPKIFKGKRMGFLSRINRSLRSWRHIISTPSRRTDSTKNTGSTKSYSKMTDGDSDMALVDVEAQMTHQSTGERRIVKTTEVVTMADNMSEHAMTAAHHSAQSQQHPWIARGVPGQAM